MSSNNNNNESKKDADSLSSSTAKKTHSTRSELKDKNNKDDDAIEHLTKTKKEGSAILLRKRKHGLSCDKQDTASEAEDDSYEDDLPLSQIYKKTKNRQTCY